MRCIGECAFAVFRGIAMKLWAAAALATVLSTAAIAPSPAQTSSSVRIGNGSVGNGSAYELWRMNRGSSFQLRVWRGTRPSSASPTCAYNFASNRDAMAFWREISRLQGCPGQGGQASSICSHSSTSSTARSQRTGTTIPAITTVPGTSATQSTCNIAEQERAAVERLNWIRQNPAAAGRQLGLNLSNVRPRTPLRVNPVLTQVARSRSEDMGNRRYFGHVDPDGNGPNIKVAQAGYPLPRYCLRDRSSNSIESLIAGRSTGQQAINDLIIDAGINPPGHRIHLLAMDDFFQRHTEVGIGFACVPGSPYTYYMTVLTAYPER